jgi:diaminopimelate decarboxylase
MSIAAAKGDASTRPLQEVVVAGPLCESGDVFTQKEGGYVAHRSLPAAEVGDFLVIEVAGAYGYAMASNYNTKPLCAEVLVENGKPRLVRRRQTFDDILAPERVG